MKRSNQVHLKLLLCIIGIVMTITTGIGRTVENSNNNRIIHRSHNGIVSSPTIIPSGSSVDERSLPFLSKKVNSLLEESIFMADTACTSITMDTFFVNAIANVDSYTWTVPMGAQIIKTIGDTMVILDWTNSAIGLQNICVQTENNCGLSTPVCFPIQVLVCNTVPNAVDDIDTTASNTAIIVAVQNNDSDPENDILTTSLSTSQTPINGTIVVIDNDIRYSPNNNFTGIDRFDYQICDNGSPFFCDTATVTIYVENAAPIAINDDTTTIAGVGVTIPVLNNDSDKENHNLTISISTTNSPTNGTVNIMGGNVAYTPDPSFTGTEQFDYIICDNGNPSLCDTATITIGVNNVAPVAVDDRDTTLSNEAISIVVQENDNDYENGTLSTTISLLNSPSSGTLSLIDNTIQYTPNTNFTGIDNFDYIICDNGNPSLCDTATVTIVVLNRAPLAVDDATSTPSGISTSIPVQDNDSDPENGILTTSLDANNGPTNGTVSLNGDSIIYTPNLGFSGSDAFDYIICDNGNPSLCDTATVTINTENQAPVAIPDVGTTPFNTAIIIDVQENDSDPENGILITTLNPNASPSNGVVSVLNNDSILYTPNNGFLGVDQFEYIICDSGSPSLCDTTLVTISIPNDHPIAINDFNNTIKNNPVNGQILGNDFDPNEDNLILNTTVVTPTSNGALSLQIDGSYIYTPLNNFIGEDHFQYQICDDNPFTVLCDTATVIIKVIDTEFSENRPPVANPDNYLTEENLSLTGQILSNDIEPDKDNILLNTNPISVPMNGMVSIFSNGNFTYTPNSDFTGEDSFVYTICDTGNPFLCDTTTVTINIIENTSNSIFATDDAISGTTSNAFMGDVSLNDFDPEGDNFSITILPVENTQNGNLVLNNNGTYTYNPTPGYFGPDKFVYEICDNQSPKACDTATAYITILLSNRAPIAINNNNHTLQNLPTTGNVLLNDFDLDEDELTINTTPLNGPNNGNVVINPDGSYTYTPNLDFVGSDIFEYEICDDGSPSLCSTASVNIEVIENNPLVNTKPVAINDNFITVINTAISTEIIINDFDPDGDNITINTTPISQPENGTVSIQPNGTIIYTPKTDFTGIDDFLYSICDNGNPSLCDTAKVTINIISSNPSSNFTFAYEDSYLTLEDVGISGNLLSNDTDPEGDNQFIQTQPFRNTSNGVVTINSNGTFTYVPTENYTGNDQFDYIICDDGTPTACDTTTAFISILPVNDAPLAINDTLMTSEDTPLNGEVLPNDSDIENETLTVNTIPVNQPTNGTLVLNTSGTFLYTPDQNYTGIDSFLYEVCDNGMPSLCDTATVLITISPINDKPLADNDTNTTDEDIAVNGTVINNDTDPDNDNLTVTTTPTKVPNNGILSLLSDGTYTYTPNLNYNGLDSFQYEVCDIPILGSGASLCDTATVLITINPINDNPLAINDNVSTQEDTPVNGNILPNDSDIENDNLIVNTTPVEEPDNGTLVLNPDGSFTYTPVDGFNGTDTFQYEVCDDGTPSLCDTATVTINIGAVNDPPIAVNDNPTIDEDTPLSGSVLGNDSDPENDNLTVNTTPVNQPDNGVLILNTDGTFTYTPNPDFNGTDNFQYEVCDDGMPVKCDTATVTITINPINDAPMAMDDKNTTDEDTPVNGIVEPNDFDLENDNLIYTTTLVTAPINGDATLNTDGSYTYTPDLNYNGLDSFYYEVCDNGNPSLCDTAAVIITINPINNAPIAVNDSITITEDGVLMSSVIPNDSDIENDNLTVSTTPVEEPDNGMLVLNTDGTFTYTPDPNFNGVDSFQYEICDDGVPVQCDTATVIITVEPDNDAPLAVNDTLSADEDTPIIGSVVDNDLELDGDILSVNSTPIEAPSNGTLTLNPDGTFIYTPEPSFNGIDSFQYEVCDNGLPIKCDTATVILYIAPENDPPIAINDINVTPKGITTTGNALNNDFDPEENDIFINTMPVATVNNGVLIINPDGTYEYTPNPDFTGADQFQYEICDNGIPSLCDTATVVIEVINNTLNFNDSPIAINDNFVTILNTPIPNVNLLTNDFDPDLDNITLNVTPIDFPNFGVVSIQEDGSATYTPDLGFIGDDYFTYQICDDGLPRLCDTARVAITVLPSSHLKNSTFAGDDAGLTLEDTPLIGILNDNDSDPEGDEQFTQTSPASFPMYGLVTINSNGSFEYIPNPGYTGPDRFRYVMCDNGTPVACDTATVYLTILPDNDPPVAINDINVTPVNIGVTGDVLANDFEMEGDSIILNNTPTIQPTNGTVFIDLVGTYTYTPNQDFVGEDYFEYEICDNGVPFKCDTARVTIEVVMDDPIANDFPIGVDDNFVTYVNTEVGASIISNDFDPDGDNLFISPIPISSPKNGVLTINSDGTFKYIPNFNFQGNDSFLYKVCEDGSPNICDTVTVTITVIPSNETINYTFGNDDVANTNEDIPVSGNLIVNDTDPEGDAQTINTTPLQEPIYGNVVINPDGTFTYIPITNYFGPDKFVYLVCDDGTPSACDSATVYLNILSTNDAPIALEDVNNTILNTPVSGNVLTNDLELEGDSLACNTLLVTIPTNGVVSLDEKGLYTYTPNNDFIGEDIFSYTVCDTKHNSLCDTTNVIIEVLKADPLVNNPPNGVEDNIQTDVNEPWVGYLLINDSDIDGDKLIINTNALSAPASGTVSLTPEGLLTYTPETDFAGEVQFTYEVCDDGSPSLCDEVTVTIDVIPNPLDNRIIYATDDAGTMWEDHSFSSNLLANDQNPAWDTMIVNTTPVKNPVFGTVEINDDASYTYTPYPNYYGPDQFLYLVCDDKSPKACDTATVYLTVLPVQDAPIAADDINLTVINTPVSGQVLTNDKEVDGDPLMVTPTPFSLPQNGTVDLNTDGTYTYTPNTDFIGEDTFEYIVCDDQNPALCDTALVTITIIDNTDGQNNAPVGVTDNGQGIINNPISGNLISNDIDPDGDPLVINTTPIVNPMNGTLIINTDGTYTYTPNTDFVGVDQFEYEVCDLGTPTKCDTVIVNLEVIPDFGNNVFANNDAFVSLEDNPLTGNLIINDIDPQGHDFAISTLPIRLPQHGTLNINPDGTFLYNPRPNYNGPDQFDYQICDNGIPQACDIATAFLIVTPVNDTLCKEQLPTPTLLSDGAVCFTEDIYLFTQENYPPIVLENADTNYQFIWYNSLGDTLAKTTQANVTLSANHPLAISPFTVQVVLGDCISNFANPLEVEIYQLPVIAATNSSGSDGVCKNNNVQLFATSVENATYEWRIQGQSDLLSTDQNPVIVGLEETTTFEVMVMPNACDTSATATVTVKVNQASSINPTPVYTLNADCSPSDLTLLANVTEGDGSITNYNWTGPDNFTSLVENPVIANVAAINNGSYTLTVTDENGCTTTESVAISNITDAEIQPVIAVTGPTCEGGSITLKVGQYASANVTYTWSTPNNTTQNISGLNTNEITISPASALVHDGDYSVQINVDGCQLSSAVYNLNMATPPTVSPAIVNAGVICNGGQLELAAFASGSTSLTYEWSGPLSFNSSAENPVIANVNTSHNGTYTVKATSQNGCATTASLVVTSIVEELTIPTITSNSPVCIDDTIKLAVQEIYTGNTILYNWINGIGGNVGTGSTVHLPAHATNAISPFRLQVTVDGCRTPLSVQHSVEIIEKPTVIATNNGNICAEEAIQLFANDIPNATYAWNIQGNPTIISTQQNPIISNIDSTTTFELQVTISGCNNIDVATTTVEINEAVAIQPTISYILNADCSPSDLNLLANVTVGNSSSINYYWTGPNNFTSSVENPVIANVTAINNGSYTLTVTDENGCTTTKSVAISNITNEETQPVITATGSTCEGGSIILKVDQYTSANVTYTWSTPNNTTQNISGLNTNEITISPTNALVHGGDYSVQINVDGCQLSSAVYNLNMATSPTVNPAIVNAGVICDGGQLELAAFASGSTSLTYEWSGPSSFNSSAENPVIANANTSHNGTYTVKVTSQNGCATTASLVVTSIVEDLVIPTITSNSPVCIDDTIKLAVQEIYTGNTILYNWINGIGGNVGTGSTVYLPAHATNAISPFRLQITVDGCRTPLSVQHPVEIIEKPTVIVTNNGNICAEEAIQLFANDIPNATYAWNVQGNPTIISTQQNPIINNIDSTTTFELQVTIGGCNNINVARTTIEINEAGAIQPSTSYSINADCSPANLNLKANGTGNIISYQWEGPNDFQSRDENPVITNVTEAFNGTYTLTIVDGNGCTTTNSIFINDIQNNIVKPQIIAQDQVCASGNLVLMIPAYEGANVDYKWYQNGELISTNNTNTLFIDDAQPNVSYTASIQMNNCLVESNAFTPIVFGQPTVSIDNENSAICATGLGEIVLNTTIAGGQAPYDIKWSGPAGFSSFKEDPSLVNVTSELAGEYAIEITDKNGCTAQTSTEVTIQDAPTQPVISNSGPVCSGGLITLKTPLISGAEVKYNWLINGVIISGENGNEITIGPISNNRVAYEVIVQAGECSVTSEAFIPTILPAPSINPLYNLTSLCEGGNLELSANLSNDSTDNLSYNWVGPNGYTSTAKNPLLTNVNENHNGSYTLTVTTLTGCEISKSLAIAEITNTPKQPTIVTNGSICKDGMIELSVPQTEGSANTEFIWINGNGDTIGTEQILTIAANDELAITPYYVEISENGCTSILSAPVQIELVEIPQISASNNGPICQGDEVQLTATEVEGATYTWIETSSGNVISNERSPIIKNLDNTANFEVSISLGGCINNEKVVTTVEMQAVPVINNITQSTTLCEGETIVLSAENANPTDELISYTWTGPNGFNFTSETRENLYPTEISNITSVQGGTYELALKSNSNCESSTRSITISVNKELASPILSTTSAIVCGGQSIMLTASIENSTGVTYDWFVHNDEGELIQFDTTTTPTLLIPNVTIENTDEYVVRVSKNNCVSGYSNSIAIKVLDTATEIVASNNTGPAEQACEGSNIQLAVPFFENATYKWFGPGGFTADSHNPVVNDAKLFNAGEYFAVITLGDCANITSTKTIVYVNAQPAAPTIINDGPVCLGSSVTLEVSSPINSQLSDSLEFNWFDASSNALIGTTTEPNLTINNISTTTSYYVLLSINGCTAEASAMSQIEVIGNENLSAFAGNDQNLCTASQVELQANEASEGAGQWTSPTGAIIQNPMAANTTAINLQVGINQFVWTVSNSTCAIEMKDTVEITVNAVTTDKAFAGIDRELCELTTINLEGDLLAEAEGIWTQTDEQAGQGVQILEPRNPRTAVEGLEGGNTYTFTWSISQGNCIDFEVDEVNLTINDMPPDNALIREEIIFLCNEDQLELSAEIPTFSTGSWSTNSNATIADATNPNTFAENLNIGENIFIWSLSNGACEAYSTDTLRILVEGMPQANSDVYSVPANDSLVFNVQANDVIALDLDYSFIITRYPENGDLVENEDGTMKYIPNRNFFGPDEFRYKLCSETCESLCDTATVLLNVNTFDSQAGECIIPNVISPNGDGNNDLFIVSCLDLTGGNELKIFNRWGDKVYETANYQNDWFGTYLDQPLPPGTYFYSLRLGEGKTPIQGFITIFR